MKWALITGASSGLGTEFAWQLAAEPVNLVLVARREKRLQLLAEKIRATLGVEVEVLPADLSTDSGQKAVIARLGNDEKPVAVLVNNAGFGLGQSFIGGEWRRESDAWEVMGRAVARLSYEAARAMLRRVSPPAALQVAKKSPLLYRALHSVGRASHPGNPKKGGVIINVSSATAYTSMGSYAAIKTWVRFFSESLASELKGSSVSVTTVCPGLMRTEFHHAAKMNTSVWPRVGFISVEQVVQETIEAARRRHVLVTPTIRYKILLAGARLAPRWLIRQCFGARLSQRALAAKPVSLSHSIPT